VTSAARGHRRLAALLLVASSALAGCSVIGGSDAAAPEPTPTPRTGPAETRHAVPYATTAPRQTLDLYLPAGDGRTVFPLVVLIHGGGFVDGSAAELSEVATRLVGQGFAAASLDYRLSGDAPFPAGVQDVRAAVRYLRANALGWGVDPHRFAAWGESAGGYLASMIGATAAEKTFDDPALGNPGVSSGVQVVVSWFGPADFGTMDAQVKENGCDDAAQQHGAPDSPESRWLGGALDEVPDRVQEASVVRQVGAASALPPFLLVHGTRDCTVPPGQSEELAGALRARGARVTLVRVEGAEHSDPRITAEQEQPSIDFLRTTFGLSSH